MVTHSAAQDDNCVTFRRPAHIAMGNAINGNITDITSFVLLAVAPLNLIKGTLVSVLTLLLYKRIAKPLFGLQK